MTTNKTDKDKVWEEIAANLNQEEFDEEIVAQESEKLSQSREFDSLLKREKKLFSLLLQTDTSKAWRMLKSREKNRTALIRKVFAYAASVLLLVSTGYMLHTLVYHKSEVPESYTIFSVPNAEMGNVVLADGTRVFLNSASELRYAALPGKSREVFLKGEAYFEVTSDKKNPFLVHLNDFTVKVTGTHFDVKSYPHSNTEATLLEGEISVLDQKGSEVVWVKPGESVVFDRSTRRMILSKVNASSKTEWRSGKIYFKNKTIGEIAATLERWYDVKFQFADESIKQVRLTGTILKNKPIEQILEILKISEPIDFEYKYKDQVLSTIKISYMQ